MSKHKNISICHISSVHPAGDPRIRRKQLDSIADFFPRVSFITGDICASLHDPKIKIYKEGFKRQGRLWRISITTPLCIFKALQIDADIYHLHDPELLPWARLLKWRGKQVIYDVHEDYLSSVSQKRYIPAFARRFAAVFVTFIEKALSSGFHIIIAEKYYKTRFPKSQPILNYPILKDLHSIHGFKAHSKELLYTGNVTVDRGALEIANITSILPSFTVTAVGKCTSTLFKNMEAISGAESHNSLKVIGVDEYVDFSKIRETYAEGKWLAGLALFPDTPHYREKQLTKFFEYMAIGLPIIASDFPVWKELIEDQKLGICVPPHDEDALEFAIEWLHSHPEEAYYMGQRGKELASRYYNWENQANQLIDFYLRIISN